MQAGSRFGKFEDVTSVAMPPRTPSPSAKVPALSSGFLPLTLLPFAVPFAVTLALLATVGEGWPRDIAPGSGLKLAGLMAAIATGACVWKWLAGRHEYARVRRLAAVICLVTGAMGWPVWTAGALPSVNGASLHDESVTPMRLDRLDVTHASKGPRLYYWARLEPLNAGARLAQGRYFIPEATYRRWAEARPRVVRVRHAKGLLGAEVVTQYR